jgi:hypothetical protein
MTKRRRRLLLWFLALALVAVVGVLAMPAVYWRLIGWAKVEPFWRGRPLSYRRETVAACNVAQSVCWPCGLVVTDAPPQAPWLHLYRRKGSIDKIVWRVADHLELFELMDYLDAPPFRHCDGSAVPILTALLGDSDPKVRYCAVQELGCLNEAGRPALPELRGLAGDRGEVFPGLSIADAVPFALYRIDREAWESSRRP